MQYCLVIHIQRGRESVRDVERSGGREKSHEHTFREKSHEHTLSLPSVAFASASRMKEADITCAQLAITRHMQTLLGQGEGDKKRRHWSLFINLKSTRRRQTQSLGMKTFRSFLLGLLAKFDVHTHPKTKLK